jgi:hypothetical protein
MPNATSAALPRVVLDWRHGRIGPPAPCVLCGRLAICRSPVKGEPCHKRCAEAWITAATIDPATRAHLIARHTPKPKGRP